ncbi:MAG TPA: hypothetical protein DIV86_04835 [Alphaproteobacteria bacterium]|nr:hypothetical protein [Alphaproteobacteria bacterium]
MVLVVTSKEKHKQASGSESIHAKNEQAGNDHDKTGELIATGFVGKALYHVNRFFAKTARSMTGWGGGAGLLKGVGKAFPVVSTAIVAAESVDIAKKAIHAKSLEEGAQTVVGGGVGIFTDISLLGGLMVFGPPGWLAAAGYAVAQGTSYILTDKTIGQHVGDLGVRGFKALEKKYDWFPNAEEKPVEGNGAKDRSGSSRKVVLASNSPEKPQISDLRESLPPPINLPGGGVIIRGGTNMGGGFRPSAPYTPSSNNAPENLGHRVAEGRNTMG